MSGPELTIKRLSSDDDAILRNLIIRFEWGTESRRQLGQLLERTEVYLLAALHRDTTAGFLLAYELPRLSTDDKMMFIYEIEVAEEYQNQGLGRTLVETVLRHCHFQGFTKAFVVTEESNVAAMKLYQSCGGKRSHEDDVVFKFETRSG